MLIIIGVGTTNTSIINQKIYDKKNDFSLDAITFEPFLTEPNRFSPAVPTLPQIPETSPNDSPAPDQNGNPTEPQTDFYGIAVAALIVLAGIALLAFGAVLMRRKTR